MAYLLGIDISTTGNKALLIDESGQVAGVAATENPISTPGRTTWRNSSASMPPSWGGSTPG